LATGSERALQRAVRAVARTVLRRGAEPPVDPASLRRVLLIRADDRVGNVLLTTPLARSLREGLPHVRIDWLIAQGREPLVDGLFLADRLIPFRRNPAALCWLVAALRAGGYDAVIDAAHHDVFSLTSALITRATGASIRIGPARGDAAHFYSHPVAAGSGNDVEAKLALLGPLGLSPRGHQLETALGLGPAGDAKRAELLQAARLGDGSFAVVNAAARKRDRRLSARALGKMAHQAPETCRLRST